jgi:hypothetical protein
MLIFRSCSFSRSSSALRCRAEMPARHSCFCVVERRHSTAQEGVESGGTGDEKLSAFPFPAADNQQNSWQRCSTRDVRTANQRASQRDDLSDADHVDAEGRRAQPPILCGDCLASLHSGPTRSCNSGAPARTAAVCAACLRFDGRLPCHPQVPACRTVAVQALTVTERQHYCDFMFFHNLLEHSCMDARTQTSKAVCSSSAGQRALRRPRPAKIARTLNPRPWGAPRCTGRPGGAHRPRGALPEAQRRQGRRPLPRSRPLPRPGWSCHCRRRAPTLASSAARVRSSSRRASPSAFARRRTR